jgi:nucleotide sugar dehydrogenase
VPKVERIVVVGIGRIGLCLALNLNRAGFAVLGIDCDRERVSLLRRGAIVCSEPGVEDGLRSASDLRLEDSIDTIPNFDPTTIFISVDTPTIAEGGYDHGRVDAVLDQLCLLKWPQERVEVALMCTVLPGYCDSKAGFLNLQNFSLSYTPGFVAQGSIMRDQQSPEQILIGEADDIAGERLGYVLRAMCTNDPPLHRMSRMSAEITKLALNCALTMKIAFANAIGDLAIRAGADPTAVLGAIGADSRIGGKFLKYGYGFGGPCFPRDNRALNFFARRYDCEVLQASVTDEMNDRHLAFQTSEFLRRYAEEEPIHFSSVAYKPGTEILDESQPLALAVRLARAGRRVVIHESPAVLARLRDEFGDLFEYEGAFPTGSAS